MNHDDDEQPQIGMMFVNLLEGTPGNRHSPEGQPVLMITISRPETDGAIETIAFDLRDTRAMLVHALVTLAEYNDQFAQYLRDKYFQDGYPRDWNTV